MFNLAKNLNTGTATQAEAMVALGDLIASLDNHNSECPIGPALDKALSIYTKGSNNPNGFADWLYTAASDLEDAARNLLDSKLSRFTVPNDCEIDYSITGKNIPWATKHLLGMTPNVKAVRKAFKLACKEPNKELREQARVYLLGTLNHEPVNEPVDEPVDEPVEN